MTQTASRRRLARAILLDLAAASGLEDGHAAFSYETAEMQDFAYCVSARGMPPSPAGQERSVTVDRTFSRTLRDIASLINSGIDLKTTLEHLLYAVCHNTVWAMAGVMGIDQASGHAVVLSRHDPNLLTSTYTDRWSLASSPALLALTRNEPVIIRDAQAAGEFPGYRKEARERGYHTVVVLPLGCRDGEGRLMTLSVQSRQIVDLTEADLSFLETVVHLGAIAVDKANRIDAERALSQRLQKVLAAHSLLMRKVLSDGSVASATQMIETLLPNPIVVVDLTANLVVGGRSPDPAALATPAWREAVAGDLRRRFLRLARDAAADPGAGARNLYLAAGDRHLTFDAMVETLAIDDEAVGALVVFSGRADFGDLDHLLLESAKFALSVQMMRSHLLFRSRSRTASELFGEIVSGRAGNIADLADRARSQGIDLDEPARLLAARSSSAACPTPPATARRRPGRSPARSSRRPSGCSTASRSWSSPSRAGPSPTTPPPGANASAPSASPPASSAPVCSPPRISDRSRSCSRPPSLRRWWPSSSRPSAPWSATTPTRAPTICAPWRASSATAAAIRPAPTPWACTLPPCATGSPASPTCSSSRSTRRSAVSPSSWRSACTRPWPTAPPTRPAAMLRAVGARPGLILQPEGSGTAERALPSCRTGRLTRHVGYRRRTDRH